MMQVLQMDCVRRHCEGPLPCHVCAMPSAGSCIYRWSLLGLPLGNGGCREVTTGGGVLMRYVLVLVPTFLFKLSQSGILLQK